MQQQLPNVRGIQTAPTFVESTSMVLVYGLDLFFTRVTPSQTFDLLNDEFQYLPLVWSCFPLQICLLKLALSLIGGNHCCTSCALLRH